MDTEYDFTQTINTPQLQDEINTAGLPAPDYITTVTTAVSIFYAVPLTSDQQSTLTTVVANHVANPNYVPLATQSQINQLTSYLNNSTASVQQEARTQIIAAIAPNMPVALLIQINAAIKSVVGF
jgi:hypothetical protein